MNAPDFSRQRKRLAIAEKKMIAAGYLPAELRRKQNKNYDQLRRTVGEIMLSTTEIEYLLASVLELLTKVPEKDFAKKIEQFDEMGFNEHQKFKKRYENLKSLLHKMNSKRVIAAHGLQAHYTEPGIVHNGKSYKLDRDFLNEFRKDTEACFYFFN